MQVLINTVTIPFQVGENVFVRRTLTFWNNDVLQSAPYFSGTIKSIELGIRPASRLIRTSCDQATVLVDQITYEVHPHTQYNPFGPVRIQDSVQNGASLFATEEALLNDAGKESSVYTRMPALPQTYSL